MRRFFLITFGLLILANFICYFALDYILVRLAVPDFLRWSASAFILLQIAGMMIMIGARLLGHQPGTGMGRNILSLVMIWNLLLVLPTAAISLIWAALWWFIGGTSPVLDLDSPWRIVGLFLASLPFLVSLLATITALWQLDRFRINRMNLTIPGLPAALRGMTIVHLSDLHIGKLTQGRVLDDIVAATNRLEADLILFTGDLINMALEDLPKAFEILRAMQSRHGLFLCEGNHDLIESRSGFETAIRASGLHFLLNEGARISIREQTVQILGLRWGEAMGRGKEEASAASDEALQYLLAKRDLHDFTILLAHHPAAFDRAAEAGVPLTLVGHTHGGQLMLTPKIGFGPWFYRYWSGLYQKGSSRLVVSNGAGNWFPLRIHAPAEIIHLTLD